MQICLEKNIIEYAFQLDWKGVSNQSEWFLFVAIFFTWKKYLKNHKYTSDAPKSVNC